MQALSDFAAKVRAVLIGVVTDRDYVIKRVSRELSDALWLSTGDVDSDLLHCQHGERIYTSSRLRARRENIQRRIKRAQKSFGHLGTRAVSSAEH